MDWLHFARRFWRIRERYLHEGVRAYACWHARLIGPDGLLRAEHALGKNLVVTTGLDAMCERLFNNAGTIAVMEHMAIGTGATPEAPADNDLQVEVARATAAYTKGGDGAMTLAYTFPAAGGYEPAAIAEAGLFDNAAPGPLSGTMYNRKTFAPFTKEASDTLKMTCTLTFTSA